MPQNYWNLSLIPCSYIFDSTPKWPDWLVKDSLPAHNVAAVVIYVVVFVVGVPGNLLVLRVTSSEAHQSINAIWFLNLAVADLLSCLALPIHIATVIHGTWPLGKKICPILHSFFDFNLYAGILLLSTISADRLLIAIKPIWCQNYRVPWRAWLASGVAWMLALVLTIPHFVFRVGHENSDTKEVFCFFFIANDMGRLTVTIMQFILSFLVPLVTMSVCYTYLLLRTWRRPATRSTKTLKVVVAVVTSFFVLWLPYQVSCMVFAILGINSPIKKVVSLHSVEVALSYVNCCIDPIIYVAASGGLHIRVFKSWPGRLRQLLTEGYDPENKSLPLTIMDSEIPKSQIQV